MARRKNIVTAYNPDTARGYAALQSMQSDIAEKLGRQSGPYITGSLRNIAPYDPSITTPVITDAGTLNRASMHYNDDGTAKTKKEDEKSPVLDVEDKDTGFFTRALKAIGAGIRSAAFGNASIKDAAYATWHAITNPADSWRAFQVLYNQSELSSATNRAKDAAMEKEDLDYIENTYKPLLSQYENLQTRINDAVSQGAPDVLVQSLRRLLDSVSKLLDELNEYIKTNGRKRSQVLRNLFYTTHNRDDMSIGDRISSMWNTIWNSEKFSPWYGNMDSVGGVLKGALDIPIKYLDVWTNAIDFAAHAFDTNYAMNKALQNIDAKDRRLDNLFTDYRTQKGDFNKGTDRLQYWLDLNKEVVNDKYKDARKDVLIRAKNLALGNFWFDPKKVDKRFLDIVNNDDFGVVGSLTYGLATAIPQLGSSFSDAKDFFMSMGVDAAVEKVIAPIAIAVATGGGSLIKSAGNFLKRGVRNAMPIAGTVDAGEALTRSATFASDASKIAESAGNAQRATSLALRVANSGFVNSYKTSRSVLKAIRNGSSLEDAVYKSGLTNPEAVINTVKGVQMAEAGTMLYLTNRLRQNETNAEVMDAYSQKVMDQVMKSNADINKVYKAIDTYLKSVDIDPANVETQQKLQLALGLNIQTGDETFEAIKKDARRGLNKIYNDNMTLAAEDYWEKLPFLPFFGSAIRDWGQNLRRALFSAFSRLYGKNPLLNSSFAGETTANNTYKLMDKTAQYAVDGKISKAAKVLTDGLLGKKKGAGNLASYVLYNDALGYINRKLKQGLSLGLKEGLEEGQLQLLQSRYQRGEYDNYTNDQSVFDKNSFISDLDLGANAITSYLGINYGDPDNGDQDLIHAMNIGFAVSLLFRAPAMLSNLKLSQDDNLRNAIARLRTDKQLVKLVADNYGRVQDLDHVGVFFEAMLKHGVTADRLRSSLIAMKLASENPDNKLRGNVVKGQYIDNDISLLADTDYMMKSKYTKDSLKRLHIKKGSDDHRMYILNAVRTTRDFLDAYLREVLQGTATNNTVRDLINKIKDDSIDDSNAALNEILDNIKVLWGVKRAARALRYEQTKRKYISENKDALDKELDETNPLDIWMEENPRQAFYDKKWDEYRAQKYKNLIESAEASEKNGDKASADKYREEANAYRDYSQNSKTSQDDEAAYKETIISNLFAVHKLQLQRQTLKALKDRLQFNKMLSDETGTDIDTSRLSPMIKYLEDDIKRTEKIITPEVEKLFASDFGEISGFDNYDNQIKSYTINRAMRETLLPMALAYDPSIAGDESYIENNEVKTKNGDYVLPPNVELSSSYLRWGELTKEDRAAYIAQAKQEARDNGKEEPTLKQIKKLYRFENLKKISDTRLALSEYKKELRNLQNTPQKDQTQALRDNIKLLRQKVYDAIITDDLNNGRIRRYIVNKQEKENPVINGQTIDDAQDGDKTAQDDIEQAVKNEQRKHAEGQEDSGLQVTGNEETSQREDIDETTADVVKNVAGANASDALKAANAVREAASEARSTDDDINAVNDKMSGMNSKEKAKLKEIADNIDLNETVSQVLGEDDKSDDLDKLTKNETVDQAKKDKEAGLQKQLQIVGDLKNDKNEDNKSGKNVEPKNEKPNENPSLIVFNPFDESEYKNGATVWKSDEALVTVHREINETEPFNRVLNPGVEVDYNILKPWKSDPSKANITARIYIEGSRDKGYFEVVKDLEDDLYSVHFKPTDSKNPHAFSDDEKSVLFAAVANIIPLGSRLSTHGELSEGGIHGLNRFANLGFHKSGERTAKTEDGKDVTIPIFEKDAGDLHRVSLDFEDFLNDPIPVAINKSILGDYNIPEEFKDANIYSITYNSSDALHRSVILDTDKGFVIVQLKNEPQEDYGQEGPALGTFDGTIGTVQVQDESSTQTASDMPEGAEEQTITETAAEDLNLQNWQNEDYGLDNNNEVSDADQNRDKVTSITNPDISKLGGYMNGDTFLLTYDGTDVGAELQSQILDDLIVFMDDFVNSLSSSYADNSEINTTEHNTESREVVRSHYSGTNFLYDPRSTTVGYPRVVKNVGDNDIHAIKFKYKVGTGEQLSKKLLLKGWINSCNVYYVVSGTVKEGEDAHDNLTVNLVIDDNNSKTTYLLAMRTPGVTEYLLDPSKPADSYNLRTDNQLYVLQKRLAMTGIGSVDKRGNFVDKSIAAKYARNLQATINFEYGRYNNLADQGSNVKEFTPEYESAARQWYTNLQNSSDQKLRDKAAMIEYQARIKSRRNGVSPDLIMSPKDIENVIDELRVNRNKIIDAYCSKDSNGNLVIPTQISDSVKPEEITTSNGRFVDEREDKNDPTSNPVFRNLDGLENGFGLSQDIEKLTALIEAGDENAEFGIGTGAFGNQPYAIVPATDDSKVDLYPGKGLAGKIYYILSSKLMPGSNKRQHRMPILLHEATFKYQTKADGSREKIVTPKDVHLVLDPITGNQIDDSQLVSAAEAILYLMFGKINNAGLDLSADELDALCNFIINNGEGTFLYTKGRHRTAEQIASAKLPYYTLKQFGWMDRVAADGTTISKFVCGYGPSTVSSEESDRVGLFGRWEYNREDVFPGENATAEEKQAAEQRRKDIVFQISLHMHWNTEKAIMNDRLGFTTSVVGALRRYFESNPKATEFKLFGCDDLSFKKDDFFESDEDGKIIRNKKVNGLAWLIHTGRLQTSASKQLFYAPFVYAHGVTINSRKAAELGVKANLPLRGKDDPPSVIDAIASQDILKNDSTISNVKKFFGRKRARANFDNILKLVKSRREEILKQLLDLFTTPVSGSDGKLQDYILLDISDDDRKANTTEQDIVKLLHKKALQYNQYAKKHGLKEIDEAKIYTVNFGVEQNAQMFSRNVKSQWVMYMQVFDDGSAYIGGMSAESFAAKQMPFITGVYSTLRQRGKLDIDKTRAWIKEKLGIPEANSIVTSGIMRGCSGEKVYGCMQVVTDSLTGMVMPTFLFSEKAGNGIGFHEAWHYVNLLVNNKATREKIYEEYVSKHKKLRNAKNSEVEECIAEDFRKYIEMMDGTNFTSRIKRLFNNILDFLFASRKKTEIRLIFNAIRDGRVKGMPLDPESAKLFEAEYNNIVYNKIKIPGYNVDITSNLPGINSYLDFYETSIAIGMGVIKEYNLTTADAVEHATSSLFTEYLTLQERACTDPRDKTIYNTVINNLPAFIGVIKNLFSYLGINAKLLQLAKDEKAQATDVGDNPTDGHLENNFEVSKKKNVAFRAKLFLMQNRMAHWEDDEDGNKVIVYEKGILNTPKYVPFNEAWNKILDNLWTSSTYNKRDKNGHYESTSLMGNVERLSKTDPFFYVLFDRLKELEGDPKNGIDADIELQNLIFGTVASQKPQIASMRLRDPVWMKTSANTVYDTTSSSEVPDMSSVDMNNQGSKLIPDERREWEVRDDNTIGAKRQLPRNWSSVVPYSTLIRRGVINETSVNKLLLIIKDTNKLINDSKVQMQDKLIEGKENLTNLLRGLCIPVDDQVIDRFLILLGNDGLRDLSPNEQLGVLKKIFGSELHKRRAGFGDITYFVDLLKRSKNNDYIVVKRRDGKGSLQIPIDQLFVGYAMDKLISILAQAYNDIHPSSSEFSISGPGGKTIYPISLNNELSDKLNRLNIAGEPSVQKLFLDPYCHHSLIKNLVETWRDNYSPGTRVPATQQFKLCTFVGLDDERDTKGEDYFQISETEDYIAKLIMTSRDMLILPTMSDKKTWYAIKSTRYGKGGKEESNIKLVHDVMTWFDANKTGQVRKLHFSDNTIGIFRGYFYDELDSLILYYSRDNILYLVKHPNEVKTNYHGLIKNGRMLFGGNGGLFRYAYDALHEGDDLLSKSISEVVNPAAEGYNQNGGDIKTLMRFKGDTAILQMSLASDDHKMNLNQVIEFLYKAQLTIELHPKDYGGLGKLRDKDTKGLSLDLDGFELIRRYLELLKEDTLNDSASRFYELNEGINKNLIDNTMDELRNLSQTSGDFAKMRMFEWRDAGTRSGSKIVKKNDDGTVEFNQIPYEGFYKPLSIPKFILDQYWKIAKNLGYKDNVTESGNAPKSYVSTKMWSTADYALSAIASHVANTAISIIECEKIFMGDPAFFKWKYIDKELSDGKENPNATTEITKTLPNYLGGDTFTIKVSKLREKHSDKTKRRGSVLSPGENIRDIYGLDILDKYPELNKQDYTFASLNDLKARSVYRLETYNQFKRQEFINWVKLNPTKYFTKLPKGETLTGYMQKTFNNWYTNYKTFEKAFNSFSDKQITSDIEKKAKDSTKPYDDINVADAEVIIRPEMYRYLRIAMGEWTFDEDSNGYSDEKAYNIIEGLGEYSDKKGKWMTDPELSKLVSEFLLKPLKMTYFSNENIPVSTNEDGSFNYINNPNYNKMAIFPMFGYACTTQTGKLIYDRMNKKGNEIDMLGFESAVKVGDTQNKYTPFGSTEKDANGKALPPISLDKLSKVNGKIDFLDSESDNVIERDSDGNPTGAVVSNTNPIDDLLDRIHINKQYVKNLRLLMNTDAHEADARAIGTLMFKLCFSNIENDATYGLNVKDYDGNDVKHYTGRELKNAIMATINAMTAFGDIKLRRQFVDKKGNIKESAVMSLCEEIISNNSLGSSAEELIQNGGVVASLMSRKLFELTAIKKINKEVIDKNTQGGSAIQQSMFGFSGVRNVVDYSDENAYHLLNGGNEPKWLRSNSAAYKNSMECFLSMNFFKSVLPKDAFVNWTYLRQRLYLIDHDLIYGNKTDGTESKPKPFGIGYRIPTQGQSSIFSFVVADVLPKQSGDTIIVPREFTAQTGSDFDVDKLFLSTLAYKNGEEISSKAMYVEYDQKGKDGKIKHYDRAIRNKTQYDILSKDENISNLKILDKNSPDFSNKHKMALLAKTDPKALANLLIHLYMRVLTDPRNFKLGRGSIDTVTNIIKHRILPRIQAANRRYAQGGYELLPTFLSKTKMEFATGKFGIGPYALSVTNLALTEWANISFDYGDNYWDLGDLDNPLARDESYVADWLSAMVNAHVDVAKDPYIFDLNLNNATYSMSSFLIRAGVGAGTFSFLANPYIKTLAQKMLGGKSLYGNNVTGIAPVSDTRPSVIINDMLNGTFNGKGNGDGGMIALIRQLMKSRNIDGNKQKLISVWLNIMSGKFKPENNKDQMHLLGKYVFDPELGLQAIESDDLLFRLLFGAMCLYTFKELSGYADQLNLLVLNSRVDTKKFGNTVSLQTNYVNKYLRFRYGDHKDLGNHNVRWVLTKRCQHQILPNRPDGKPKTASEISKEALDYYFDHTYLNDELTKATTLASKILSTQLYSATDEFLAILKNTLAALNGSDVYYTTDGQEVLTYKTRGITEDMVTEVSNAIDNIVRFKALQTLGLHDGYPIDLVRDSESIRKTLANILIGDQSSTDPIDRMSVFKQVLYLIDRSKSPVEGKADISDLANNELLQYITPIPPTKSDSLGFGRLLLKENAVNTGLDLKDVLRSAWYDLLTYDRASANDPSIPQDVKDRANKTVLKIAKNVVIYAYYSTYDQNGANSFFELVPLEFRKQYDDALAKGLNDKHTFFNSVRSNDLIMNILARNFWWNDLIVPEWIASTDSATSIHSYNDYKGKLFRIKTNKGIQTVPSYYLSSTLNANFFKIVRGDLTILYQKIGSIVASYNTGGKNPQLVSKNVYIPTPKAGLHNLRYHQYEFYVDEFTPSIFRDNQLPDVFSPQATFDDINKNILKNLKFFIKKVGKEDDALLNKKPDNIQFVNNLDNNALNDSRFYYTTGRIKPSESDVAVSDDGNVGVLGTLSDPEQAILKYSDFNIQISPDTNPSEISKKLADAIGDNSTNPESITFSILNIDGKLFKDNQISDSVRTILSELTTIYGVNIKTVYVPFNAHYRDVLYTSCEFAPSMDDSFVTVVYKEGEETADSALQQIVDNSPTKLVKQAVDEENQNNDDLDENVGQEYIDLTEYDVSNEADAIRTQKIDDIQNEAQQSEEDQDDGVASSGLGGFAAILAAATGVNGKNNPSSSVSDKLSSLIDESSKELDKTKQNEGC